MTKRGESCWEQDEGGGEGGGGCALVKLRIDAKRALAQSKHVSSVVESEGPFCKRCVEVHVQAHHPEAHLVVSFARVKYRHPTDHVIVWSQRKK